MDMRFGDWSEARATASAPPPIDYRCFVAVLAAAQASTPTARAAAAARQAASRAEAQPRRRGGAFHATTALILGERARQPR